MKTKLPLSFLGLFICALALAQPSQKEIDTQMVLAQDYMRQENYLEAKKALFWLLTQVPDYSKNIYIMGYKAYEKAAEASDSGTQKAIYLDSMITVFQLKEKQFGLTNREYNNLGYRYYRYFRTDEAKYEDALAVFEKVYAQPKAVVISNLPAYMSIVRQYNSKVKQQTALELMEIRSVIAKAEEAKRNQGTDPAKLKRYTDMVDQLFYETIKPTLSCEVIESLAEEEKLANYDFARMIFAWSMEFSCTSYAYFEQSAITLVNHPEGKNAGLLIMLGKRAAATKKYEEAIGYFEESIPLWTDSLKKADNYMDMARVYSLLNQKAEARKAAYKAIETDEQLSSGALSFVANLYMASFQECAEGHSITDDRAVFMAAYDLFKKAGDSEGMQAASAQFPTRSEAFTDNYEDGETIDIGCWMNVKTKVKTRRSQ